MKMWTQRSVHWVIFLTVYLCSGKLSKVNADNDVPQVHGLDPKDGSENGETYITIAGINFAPIIFSTGNEDADKGNKVTLTNRQTYPCKIHPDGTHPKQIVCITSPMPKATYDIKVSVNGVEAQYCSRLSDCQFKVKESSTPTIETVTPTSGMPGEMIKMNGYLATDQYESNTEGVEDKPQILRVYFGGQKCELLDDNGVLYGLEYSDDSKKGSMQCKPEGTYIGNNHLSYIVSRHYGRSLSDDKTKLVRSNGISMYQTFTEIKSLSLNQGSTAGGTDIIISGTHFDETKSKAKVMIAGMPCTITEPINNTAIACRTPADMSVNVTDFTGGRGLYAYVADGLIDASTINRSEIPAQHLDSSEWKGYNISSHTVLIVGYFVPVFSGNYSFCIKAASRAKVFFKEDILSEKVKIDEGTNTCGDLTFYYLEKGMSYYMEVHYSSSKMDSYVKLIAFLQQTEYSEDDTGWAEHEVQRFLISSRTDPEIQELNVTASGDTAQTPDIQRLEIINKGDSTSTFAVGLGGIFTTEFSMASLVAKDVEKALKKLPGAETDIDVAVEEDGNNKTLIITTNSPSGVVSDYDGMQLTGQDGSMAFVNTRTSRGVAASNYFTLSLHSISTPGLKLGSSKSKVESELKLLFSVQCHPKLQEGKVEEFEIKQWWMSQIVSDSEPFCGQYSLKNPNYIYYRNPKDLITLSSNRNRYLCLAFKGLGGLSRLKFLYTSLDTAGTTRYYGYSIYVDVGQVEDKEVWNYWCEDIYTLIRNRHNDQIQTLYWIKALRSDYQEDLFIDHMAIRTEKPVAEGIFDKISSMWRKPQVQPKGFFIDSVEVTKNADKYTIVLSPHHCGHNLPLFDSVNGDVSRIQESSIPITGSYKIKFKGDATEDIPVTVKADPAGVAAFLKGTVMGFSEVEGEGTCSRFSYDIKMSSQTGDQPMMSIDTSKLTGADTQTTVSVKKEGGLWLSPIMGDLLRTHHNDPQVTVHINNIPTRCVNDSECAFVFSPDATPVITSINPTSGSKGNTVMISGTGFETASNDDNQVMIGKTLCDVIGVTASSIICRVGDGPTGPAPVEVIVKDKGFSTGSINFTFVTDITNFPSISGSLEGGRILTLEGYGFTSDAEVKVDGTPCDIINITESKIECITPKAATLSTTDVDVIVKQLGSEITAGNFSYSMAFTPVITNINISSSSVGGGEVIEITGTDFGSTAMPVTLGGKDLDIISYNDTEIIAVLPSLPDGSYKLLINVDGKGYADLRKNAIPEISYIFVVNAMYPSFGSVYGGTDLYIQGEGFDNSKLKVHIGPHECDVTSLSNTLIKCRIKETKSHHHVFANGTHKSYGIGYAWNKDNFRVNVGDMVTWHWETPFYVNDMQYSVRQTAKANELKDMPGGFSSGQNTRKGSFTHTFTVPGTYHYWTGYMDSSATVYFRGSLNVVALDSSIGVLSVKILKTESTYNTSASGIAPTFQCPLVTSNMSGCVDNAVLNQQSDKFNFEFRKCFSPYINSLDPTSGSFDDIISLDGAGFGDTLCQNEVTYGENGCTTITNASSSLQFKISPSCESPIGELHKFVVRVHNLGYALMSLPLSSSTFGLIPIVNSISPETGSKVGGTKVTISGAGFIDNILVQFEKLSCEIESLTYTQIVCITKCSSSPENCHIGQMTFSVMVGIIKAKCDDAVCVYETTLVDTPEVDSVTPNSVNADSTVLTFTGQKFGSAASNLTIMIGGVECHESELVNETYFTCVIGRLPAGDNDVVVYVSNLGKAATSAVVNGEKIASISSPLESSIHGGATLVISGNGFVEDDTIVLVGGVDCSIQSVNLSQVMCTLPANAEGEHDVDVTSKKLSYPSLSINYTSGASPAIDSIDPSDGVKNDSIVITGQGFDSPAGSQPKVTIGGAECTVTAATSTSITFNAGVQSTGRHPVQVFVEARGLSNKNILFTYKLSDFTVSPSSGSPNGGQTITLSGSGFLKNATEVNICGQLCEEISVTSSAYVCKTSAHEAKVCDVVAVVHEVVQNETDAYTYDAALESTITGVSPARGGTGGGTLITINGTNFGSSLADIDVRVGESDCDVQTVTDDKITCRTGASNTTVITKVEVQRNGQGLAQQISAEFEYIDVWSSVYTWGGVSIPQEGDFIIIRKGQTILLDTDTPVLKMLLIQGGHLVFDDRDIELHAEHILITDGGVFQIGTEENKFQHKATITMYGHVRSKELPIYGAKGIGLREGFLELHGKEVPITWTKLSQTAAAGESTLFLKDSVTWEVGSQIVIATTGDRLSQRESEVRKITAVSGDGTELTLDQPLEYEHIAVNGTFGSRFVQFQAEVGLLTRNILIRGYRNVQFDHQIKACPDGFQPGQFSTQTCFQGRFGEEVGSDQYGVHILIHQQEKDTQVAQCHIENIEVTHAGQAFRLGRYPIHFHLNGNMSDSYVRGCAIHHTFNRAVNIHGSHNAMVERNVVYNVMGGALFLEDGDEVGNTFQYNLEIFIRASTSLRNDDITPAGIWATNPYNFIRHNAVAGGTHFGTWYRLHKNPDGPGYSVIICPQGAHMGEFRNNSAHSQGWYGLWIFETYIPREEECSGSSAHRVAKFHSLTSWSNNKGAEAVNVGSVQFRDFVIVNNQLDGIQFSLIKGSPPKYDPEEGPGIFNSVIVAHHEGLKGPTTKAGIVQPHFNGFMVKDVEFYNFNEPRSSIFTWVTMAGVCMNQCGGFTTVVSNLTFVNSPRKVRFAWENEGVIHDLDGSFTGKAGGSAVACSGSFDPGKCKNDTEMSLGVEGCICSNDVKLIRFAFNDISPDTLLYKRALFTSDFGTTYSKWIEKRISHKKGWQAVLMANTSYDFYFEDADHVTNISYKGRLYRFSEGDYLIFTQSVYQMPDKFKLDGVKDLAMTEMPSHSNVAKDMWSYNSTATTITYSLQNNVGDELPVSMKVQRCFFRGCKPPPSPMAVVKQPENAEYTSNLETWKNLTIHGKPPEPMDDIFVSSDRWIVVDTLLPKLGKVVIEGGLQFFENFTKDDQLLEADYIYIKGRLVAGWSNENPLYGKLTIRLRGDHSTPNYLVTDGPNLGSKFIAVFGGLQLHGKDRGITKTHLASEATVGDLSISVKHSVDWKIGEEILISTTDYNAWHTETFKITGVSGKTISLNGTIKYRHIAHEENFNGNIVQFRASVALLTRNILVEGAKYDDLIKESFGARIIVGQTADESAIFSGFAQISNVEFYHCGQEGFASNYDARYALTFSGVSSIKGKIRYSYVRYNAFHNCFSPAIGVFGTENMEIEGNTIYHTVGSGIHIEAVGTQIINNLVTLSIWPGAYLNRNEPDNYDFSGAIDGLKASQLVMLNNTIAGSERLGYAVPGLPCDTEFDDKIWFGNVAHGAQSGIGLFLVDTPASSSCVAFMGFILWKNFDYGIYYNNNPSLVVKHNIFAENGVGITPFIIGPGAVGHDYADKSVTVEKNLFIGKTASFSENLDIMPSDDNVKLSGQARGLGSEPCGKISIMTGTFSSGGNSSPRKPWLAIMSYQAINGVTYIKENTFANFGACTGGRDHIIGTNKFNDDVIHPVLVTASALVNVEPEAKILFHVPNLGKVNPSDCVDMDCDGHKKCLVTDLDGSFLGFKGNVLPDSAYEWDGKPGHGVGDYRIPTALITDSDGNKIEPNDLAPHKGLYKIDQCQWKPEWVAYQCNNDLEWRMLVAESLDADTETRRLSPIAVYNQEGYIDLVNGPQDHGWCSGYTCQKRLSTFPILVALDQPFSLYLSSTNPTKMRFMLLNSRPNDCVALSMWYTTINRIEVKVNGTVKIPTNGFFDKDERYRIKLEEVKGELKPKVKDKVAGENYVSQEDQIVTWIQCGGSEVIVTRLEAVLVSFTLPAMTVDEFFGDNLVENLAGFLKIDPKKVRVVSVVANTSPTGKRKKRETVSNTVSVEISDTPGETPSIDYTEVNDEIVNMIQFGSVEEVLKVEVLYTSIIGPDSDSGTPVVLQKPGHLVLHTHPEGLVSEDVSLTVQPKLKVTDTDGKVVTQLGSATNVWQIEASIKSGGISRATLLGTTMLNFTNGWANFTDLAVSDLGNDYILEFKIVSPPEAINFSISTNAVIIFGKQLGPKATLLTSKRLTNTAIELEVSLKDKNTNLDFIDIGWDGHTWEAEIEVYDKDAYKGTLSGITKVSFDPAIGKAKFSQILLDKPGNCPLMVTIKSDPEGYLLKMLVYVDLMTPEQDSILVEESRKLEIKFPITFNKERAPHWASVVVNTYSSLPGLRIINVSYLPGSIIFILDIEASKSGYNSTLFAMCGDIEKGRNFTFDGTTVKMAEVLKVDGKPYYGVSCGRIPKDDDEGLDLIYIIIIAVLGFIILILLLVVIYKCCINPSPKTNTLATTNTAPVPGYYYNQNDLLADVLLREETSSSLKSRSTIGKSAVAPMSTKQPHSPFDLGMKSPNGNFRHTPSPAWTNDKY